MSQSEQIPSRAREILGQKIGIFTADAFLQHRQEYHLSTYAKILEIESFDKGWGFTNTFSHPDVTVALKNCSVNLEWDETTITTNDTRLLIGIFVPWKGPTYFQVDGEMSLHMRADTTKMLHVPVRPGHIVIEYDEALI